MKSKLFAILLAIFPLTAFGADIASVNFNALKDALREYYFSKPENADLKERFNAAEEVEKKFESDIQDKIAKGDKPVDFRAAMPPKGMMGRFELERKIDADLKKELYLIISELGLKYDLIYDASETGAVIYAKAQVDDVTTLVKQKIIDLGKKK
jgi:hypothetical protein